MCDIVLTAGESSDYDFDSATDFAMATQFRSILICPICNQPVPLESAKADERGRAIHEDCYLLKINLHKATILPTKDSLA